jgi:lysophospholipase L1-like esterase
MKRAWEESRKGLIATGIGIVITLLFAGVCEGTYRLIKLHSLSMPVEQWTPDPDLVYNLNPENPEYPGSFRQKTPGADPEAAVRIVCMGGSTTFGHGVHAEEAWPAICEGVLREGGIRAEVINAGVPGFGTRQHLVRYDRDIAQFKPHIVVLFLGWNGPGALVDRNGFVPGSVPRTDTGLLRRLWISVARHSLIFQDLVDATRSMRVNVLEGGYKYPTGRFLDTLVEDTRSLINEIVSNGQLPVLIIHPAIYYEGMSDEEIALFRPKLWNNLPYDPIILQVLGGYQSAIRSVAKETATASIDLEECLRRYKGKNRSDLFLDEMHMSVSGNRVAGICIGKALSEIIQTKTYSSH